MKAELIGYPFFYLNFIGLDIVDDVRFKFIDLRLGKRVTLGNDWHYVHFSMKAAHELNIHLP